MGRFETEILTQAQTPHESAQIDAEKHEKQSDFACFNGLCMLLSDARRDVCNNALALVEFFEEDVE